MPLVEIVYRIWRG